jgi:Protein of unknown function (DUF3618)
VADKQSTTDIEREIEQARVSLASSLDQLVERTSPKRLAQTTKDNLVARIKTREGMTVLGAAAAGIIGLVVLARIRAAKKS